MKKFLALIIAMLMVASLAACGGDASVEASASQSAEATYTEEQKASLTEVYNTAAILYNKIAAAAEKNGWMADEQTATEVGTVEDTLKTIGTALIGDMNLLDGMGDFDSLVENIDSLIPELEGVLERVSKPYAAE